MDFNAFLLISLICGNQFIDSSVYQSLNRGLACLLPSYSPI